MATYKNSILGEIRGTIGSWVFGASAGRKTIRGYSKPVQPNTLNQLRARAAFGSASQSYHALTDTLKLGWESYSKTIFNAKDQFNEGQWNGANAFVSLRNLVNMSNNSPLASYYSDDLDNILDGAVIPFTYNEAPPVRQLQANIESGVPNNPSQMIVETIQMDKDAKFIIDISFGGILPGGLGQDTLIDGADNAFGLAFYISEVLTQEHQNVRNRSRQLIGMMPPIDAGVKTLTASMGLKMLNDTELDITGFKSFPHEGNIVQGTVYSISEHGMIACIGSAFCTVVADLTMPTPPV